MHRSEHVETILRRAAQIEAERLDPAATLTDTDLVEAGKAAGLSEEAVRQAIAEQRLAPAGARPASDDLRWTVSRRVPRLTDGQRAEMFSTLRRAAPYRMLGAAAPVETFGQAQQVAFDVPFTGQWARLRIAPADADHDVWTYDHHAHADVYGASWWVPALAFFPILLVVGLFSAAFGVSGPVGSSIIALFTLLSTFLAAPVRRRILAKRRRQFDAVTADLDHLASASTPAETPVAAPLLTLEDEPLASDEAAAQGIRTRA